MTSRRKIFLITLIITAIIAIAASDSLLAQTVDQSSGGLQKKIYSNTTLIALSIISLVLGIIALILTQVKKSVNIIYKKHFPIRAERKGLKNIKAKLRPGTWPHKVFVKHPVVAVVLGVFILLTLLSIAAFDYGNRAVGVQIDYAPTQPIIFSHITHSDLYKINCLYCHSDAAKSKNASIPTTESCMNCHNFIQVRDLKTGLLSPEIEKLYKAVGWNATERIYDTNAVKTTVKWVRVSNLPDLAYFNHAQHVKLGNIECQSCHGPIETMKVVKQQKSLQMGWCINCHRNSEVDISKNKYYEMLHDSLKYQGNSKIKLEQLGGLDCGKCHY